MDKLDGTVYVYVDGGVVQNVEISRAFGANINVEIWDFDNEDCDCHSDKGTHSHETYEFPAREA